MHRLVAPLRVSSTGEASRTVKWFERRSAVALVVVLAVIAAVRPVRAEPEKRFGVGIVLTDDVPSGDARSGVKLRPLFRMRSDPGLHPAFGLNWVTLVLGPDSPTTDALAGRLRLRPLLGGVSYTWVTDLLSISPRVFAGYSFNRFRRTSDASARNSLVAKAELQLFHDLNPRVGIVGSIGYLVARPQVAGRTVRADDLRLQVGLAYAVY